LKSQVIDNFFDTKKAACRGKDITLFYPVMSPRQRRVMPTESAKFICSKCSVLEGCLEYSLHFEPLGVWGGKNEVEREVLRRKKNIVLPIDRQASHSVRRSVNAGRVDRIVNRLDFPNE
jgi:WhiB family transcriptional regulator, redox-sensing transcriptional regulator